MLLCIDSESRTKGKIVSMGPLPIVYEISVEKLSGMNKFRFVMQSKDEVI